MKILNILWILIFSALSQESSINETLDLAETGFSKVGLNEISGADYEATDDTLYLITDEIRNSFYILENYSTLLAPRDATVIRPIEVMINNIKFFFEDVEDASLGPCPNSASKCFYIADTGSNFSPRQTGRITIIELDKIDFSDPENVSVDFSWNFTFNLEDSGYKDIEAIAVHPENNTLFLTTKGSSIRRDEIYNQNIYSISLNTLSDENDETVTAALVFNITASEEAGGLGGNLLNSFIQKATDQTGWITGMDFSSNGKELLLSTYDGFMRFEYDSNDFNLLDKVVLTDSKFESVYYFMDQVGLISEYAEKYRIHTPGWFGGTTRQYLGHNVFHTDR